MLGPVSGPTLRLEIESLSVALVERHGVRVETWDGVTLGALFDLACANLGER